jgi:hypothetical protein
LALMDAAPEHTFSAILSLVTGSPVLTYIKRYATG